MVFYVNMMMAMIINFLAKLLLDIKGTFHVNGTVMKKGNSDWGGKLCGVK